MACDLNCPSCGATLGKDTECDALAWCGNCGEDNIFNERGDRENMTPEEKKRFNITLKKMNKNSFNRRRW